MNIRKTGQYNNYAYFAKLDCGIGVALFKCQSCGKYIYIKIGGPDVRNNPIAMRELRANNIDVSGRYGTNGTENTDKSVTCRECFDKMLEMDWP